MRKPRRCFYAIIALLLLNMGIPSVLAHEGAARLDLSAQRSSPGADLEVRGINIASEMSITLALVGEGAEFPLGVVMGDAHGDFVQAISIPREAVAGAYNLRAFGSNRVVVAAPLTLIGIALEEQAQQRGEDEPLLIPLPERERGALTQPALAPAAQSARVPDGPATIPQSAGMPLWPAVVAIVVVLVALVFAVGRRRIRV
jgi:hypothetical protein